MQDNHNQNNAVIEADAPADELDVQSVLADITKVYKDDSLEAMLKDKSYTAELAGEHAASLINVIDELYLSYQIDNETVEELELLAHNIHYTQLRFEEGKITAELAAENLSTYTADLTKINSTLMKTEGIQLEFAPMNFVSNLKYMGQGMLVIMLVMGILIGGTILLNYVTNKISEARNGNKKDSKGN